MIARERTAFFTGHRNIEKPDECQLPELLDELIDRLYQRNVIYYGAGGAYGFDMLAEQAVLRAKIKHSDIKLILVLPCKEQDKYWSAQNRNQYREILQKADKIVYIAETYDKGCMHRRNRHLADYSGYSITYLKKSTGGTAYTVRYAREKGIQIINLAACLKKLPRI